MNPIQRLLRAPFWVNLLAAMALIFLLGIAFFISLGYITRHGQVIQVPDVVGQTSDQASKLLRAEGFGVVVVDSAYIDSLPGLTVLRQSPVAQAVVKINRTIQLTLNKTEPPTMAMPNLVNLSFRSALLTLVSLKLQLGDTVYKPDIAKNAVLQQLLDGKPIAPGTMVPEGSSISLILGDGVGNQANPVPNLIGLTYMQARDLLSASDLNLGVVLYQGAITDTLNAFVFRQLPIPKNQIGFNNLIYAGQSVDIWIAQSPLDTTGNPIPHF